MRGCAVEHIGHRGQQRQLAIFAQGIWEWPHLQIPTVNTTQIQSACSLVGAFFMQTVKLQQYTNAVCQMLLQPCM